MTFADQWANRHDTECEQGDIRPAIAYQDESTLCRCYVRWLEGRLDFTETELVDTRKRLMEMELVWEQDGRNAEKRIKKLEGRLGEMAKTLELPLLFHSGGVWDFDKAKRWHEITGTTKATTQVMCDSIRRSLLPPKGAGDAV